MISATTPFELNPNINYCPTLSPSNSEDVRAVVGDVHVSQTADVIQINPLLVIELDVVPDSVGIRSVQCTANQ